MPMRSWSTTPAQNNAAAPHGWPEGMPPSGVNDSARQMMADTRLAFEDMPWLDWPDPVTYANATSFIVATDLRGRYPVGRRVRVSGNATGTIYGTITAALFGGGQTTVSLVWDAGALQSEPLGIALGPSPAGQPIGLAALDGGETLATLDHIARAQVPVGSVIAWPLDNPPDGYLLCDGAEVSRTTYADLFALIGTAYGPGNGSTTFTLPDYRRRFLLGAGGAGSTVIANAVASKGGTESETLTTAQIPAHRHRAADEDTTPPDGAAFGFLVSAKNGANLDFDHSGETATIGIDPFTAEAGGGGAHNNMPPAVVVNWCIRWRAGAGALGGGGGIGGGVATAVQDLGSMGSARALDTLTFGAFVGTLNQPTCAVTLDNPNLGAAYLTRTIRLVQDATGGRAMAWPGNVAWRSGAAPTLGPAAGAANDIVLSSFDGGASWIGSEAATRIAGVVGLSGVLDGKADDGHSHAIEDIDGLTEALAAAGGGGTAVPVVALGNMGSSRAVNMALGGAFTGTLNAAACAVTFSNPALGVTYVSRVLRLTQDGTGGRTVTWPGNVTWQGGFAPAMGPAAGAVDVILLTSFDGGANWYAAIAGQFPGA